jgi:uncharacterized protein YebE (UPF0316 family)
MIFIIIAVGLIMLTMISILIYGGIFYIKSKHIFAGILMFLLSLSVVLFSISIPLLSW